MEIHRMFDTQDQSSSVHKNVKGKEIQGSSGIKSLDMSKMNPVRAFFARLTGTTVHVGGKEYLVGKKSAAEFLKRNGVEIAKTDSKSIVAGITKYYNSQVTEKAGKMSSAEDTDRMQVSKADLKLVLKAIGLNDGKLLEELQLQRTGKAEGAQKLYSMDKSQNVTLTKKEFIDVLKKHVKEIKDSKEFPEVSKWLKSAMDGKPVDPVDDTGSPKAGSPKGGSPVGGSEDLPKEEPRTELRGVNVRDRMKDAIGLGMAAGVKDKVGAQEFLNKLDQDLKEDKFHAKNAGDLKLVLQNHRGTMDVDSKQEFDRIIKFVGFTVKSDQIQEPK